MNIREHLVEQHVPFVLMEHRDTFTARETARVLHESLDCVVKSVVLRTPVEFVIALLPSSCLVDLERAAAVLGVRKVELATANEVEALFPDCEPGIVPPFGSMYKLKMMVDPLLAFIPQVVLESDNHHESIRMGFKDFNRIEHPTMAQFARLP